ncbi:MAG: tRNA (adenosine(37)-N6)-threonylcarbamoyltransferase complex transferase subunit TsaD [Bdellovibrionales bacterium]
MTYILGIESSCDETAVAVVCDDADPSRRICGHALATQLEAHRPYGGVVPEVAARAHLDKIEELVRAALDEAEMTLDQMDAIAATCGPGLIGGVMVGAMMGKALALVADKPFIAINHLEAHALVARLQDDIAFPYLLLLVSGGHCQLVLAEGVGRYRCLGTTRDDAAGECFDKSAKLLGLGYPGGPALEKAAQEGDASRFTLPLSMRGRQGCDFSFSGLKTAVRQEVIKQDQPLESPFVADMAASLQMTIASILEERTSHAIQMAPEVKALVVAGGVAANKAIREKLLSLASAHGLAFHVPPVSFCTDNGVMIAWAGLERFRLGMKDDLSVRARPRWPLEELVG